MPSNLFLQLRLVGNRFEDHSIPLDVLAILVPFQGLVVEAAKVEYLRNNVSRSRVPNGFEHSIGLKLTSLTRGSAQLDLGIDDPDNLPLNPNQESYFLRARDSLLATIQGAEQGEDFECLSFPKEMLPHFEKIARAMMDGEEIHLISPTRNRNGSMRAKFSRHVARRLRNAASMDSGVTRDIEIQGSIQELNQANMTLQILPASGDKIKAPIGAEHLDSALKVFSGFRRGLQAHFRGHGRCDFAGRVLEFKSLSQLNIIDNPSDISTQLDDIRTLENGWLDGDGIAPSLSGIDWIESRLHRYIPVGFPRPYLYPTEAGGVQLEWSIDSNEVSIEVSLESHLGVWHQLNLQPQLNLQSSDERERELNLDQSSAWEWIIRQINGMRRIQ